MTCIIYFYWYFWNSSTSSIRYFKTFIQAPLVLVTVFFCQSNILTHYLYFYLGTTFYNTACFFVIWLLLITTALVCLICFCAKSLIILLKICQKMFFKINITISSVFKCGITNAIYTFTLFSWLRFSEKLFHSSNETDFPLQNWNARMFLWDSNRWKNRFVKYWDYETMNNL